MNVFALFLVLLVAAAAVDGMVALVQRVATRADYRR
jgi:hypothetical protein